MPKIWLDRQTDAWLAGCLAPVLMISKFSNTAIDETAEIVYAKDA